MGRSRHCAGWRLVLPVKVQCGHALGSVSPSGERVDYRPGLADLRRIVGIDEQHVIAVGRDQLKLNARTGQPAANCAFGDEHDRERELLELPKQLRSRLERLKLQWLKTRTRTWRMPEPSVQMAVP